MNQLLNIYLEFFECVCMWTVQGADGVDGMRWMKQSLERKSPPANMNSKLREIFRKTIYVFMGKLDEKRFNERFMNIRAVFWVNEVIECLLLNVREPREWKWTIYTWLSYRLHSKIFKWINRAKPKPFQSDFGDGLNMEYMEYLEMCTVCVFVVVVFVYRHNTLWLCIKKNEFDIVMNMPIFMWIVHECKEKKRKRLWR